MKRIKKKKKSYKASNLPPGTIAYKGQKEGISTNIEIVNYSKDDYNSFYSKNIEDAFNFKGTEHVTWININGLNNVNDIETLGLHYHLHPLTLEDIVNTKSEAQIRGV